MLDPILEAGGVFDWITPLKALLNPIIHGPVYTFMITYSSCPHSTIEITRALKKCGVSVYSPSITGNTILFDVKLKQAALANHLMDRWGVPVENPLPKKRRKSKPRRRRRRKVVAVSRCGYCGTGYGQARMKCRQCGAPMG